MRIKFCKNKKLRFSISINQWLKDYGFGFTINYVDRGYSKNLSCKLQIWDRHLYIVVYKILNAT